MYLCMAFAFLCREYVKHLKRGRSARGRPGAEIDFSDGGSGRVARVHPRADDIESAQTAVLGPAKPYLLDSVPLVGCPLGFENEPVEDELAACLGDLREAIRAGDEGETLFVLLEERAW